MAPNWPPSAEAKSSGLLTEVDVGEMPHAAPFSACLEALASSTNVYAWIPCIGNVNGRAHEVHNHGVPDADHSPSSIPVATPDDYLNSAVPPEYLSTVLEHLGASPGHFMAFAEVLSGQHLGMDAKVTEFQEGYVTPIDWAYYNLAFLKEGDEGSAADDVRTSLADVVQIQAAASAVALAKWEGLGRQAAYAKFTMLANFVVCLKIPMYAEFGATLVAYATSVKAARTQLDGIMEQAVAAMRGLEASESADLRGTLALLLTVAGFLPGLPYAIAFGSALASAVVTKIEDEAKAAEVKPAKIVIPADRAHSCVDILRWYLDEARATCEGLVDGLAKLTKRLGELLDEVVSSVPQANPIPEQLRELPG
jgi:hypothetical protein